MAFHIPFNQRAAARRKQAPIYIGFEAPRRPRKKFNWWGFNGMWMSFASLFTAGIASPVPLLISLVGLRRPGKKMATVGTVVSLLGVAMATTMIITTVAAHNHHTERRRIARYNRVVKKQLAKNEAIMAVAASDIIEFCKEVKSDDDLDIKANVLLIENDHVDPWGKPLRFEANNAEGIVRSAGPDKSFDTDDDITVDLAKSASATAEVSDETVAGVSAEAPDEDEAW